MATPAVSNAWLLRPRPSPQARLRLFCFHYAGGSVSLFRAWARELPGQVEVCPVQTPGRENRLREQPFTRMADLLPPLAAALRPCLDKPFAFFGHSLGALTGFELARRLRSQGGPEPLHLFLSGRRAPHLPNVDPIIHQLPDAEFVEKLRELNGTPEAVLQHEELMTLLLPLLRADFAVHETYVYTPAEPLNCPISAFGGLDDSEVSRADLAAWRDQTRGPFTLRMFPGDHFFLNSARRPLLQAVAEDLAPLLG